jgi:hypothetical protein
MANNRPCAEKSNVCVGSYSSLHYGHRGPPGSLQLLVLVNWHKSLLAHGIAGVWSLRLRLLRDLLLMHLALSEVVNAIYRGLAPSPIKSTSPAWKARHRYLQLASIFGACLLPLLLRFALTKLTLTSEQRIFCSPHWSCPVLPNTCIHGLPPAPVRQLTAHRCSFSYLHNTTYKSYLNLEVYLFSTPKIVIQYHTLPICRDHHQSSRNG